MLSVQGRSDVMDKVRDMYPDYMQRLAPRDKTDEEFVAMLVGMGLTVEVHGIRYSPDGDGPHCKVDFTSYDDEEEDDDW